MCYDSAGIMMEPKTVGSLWLENDLHENELEFESHMGRSKKQVSFKKEVVVRVNDLVFWLTAWLNFENVLLNLK